VYRSLGARSHAAHSHSFVYASHRAGKHSFKYSGLANRGSNVGLTEENGAVTIVLASKKNGIKSQKTAVKKNARRSAHAAGAVAAKVRPDLVKAAKAKASALSRGIRTRKALA
jgi:large subunit ribosomal protein L28e